RHDIAHIASRVYLASSGAGFFFALFQPVPLSTNPLPIRCFIPSKFLNRGMSFLRFLILLAGLDCKKTLRRVENDLCT
ncbi:hypothetical protein, partial [Serratia marcescens]|uniref:hypothetical protein n=1 Tax=Serratia marcescens TaxID=615 RepID=UPI00197D7BA5